MLRCNSCGVYLRGCPTQCPLCQCSLAGEPDETAGAFPPILSRQGSIRRLIAWIAFGSVSAAVICFTINLILPVGGWWSLFVVTGIGSLWIDFAIMIRKRKNLPKNILWQVAAISLIAFLWDKFTGFQGWSLDYVLPILCTCSMIAMAVVARIRWLHIQDYILYLVLDCILGIVSLVLIIMGTVRIVIPSAICFGVSVIFLASLLFFEGKALRAEFQRRLHM